MVKKINPKYVPKSLSETDKKKQIKSIKDKTDRPKVSSFTSKRSTWTKKFEDKYKTKISDTTFISKNIISKTGIDKIMKKGYAAYYSGSRPNQTPQSWANARLASVILFGPAFNVDKDIAMKYGRKQWLNSKR